MQKRAPNVIWFALGACYLIGFVWIVWSSSHNPTNRNPASESRQANKAHIEQSAFGDWLTKDAAGFFTLFLVVIGAAQAGLFVWQLRYMSKSLTDAKLLAEAARDSAKTAQQQVEITKIGIFDLERAYLACGPSQITTQFARQPGKDAYQSGDSLEVIIKIHVQNTGRTSAVLRKIYAEFSKEPPPGDVPVYKHGQEVLTDVAIPAGAESVLTPYEFKIGFVHPHYFWGYVEYRDIFKIIRRARFCAVIVPGMRDGEKGKYNLAGSDAWREYD